MATNIKRPAKPCDLGNGLLLRLSYELGVLKARLSGPVTAARLNPAFRLIASAAGDKHTRMALLDLRRAVFFVPDGKVLCDAECVVPGMVNIDRMAVIVDHDTPQHGIAWQYAVASAVNARDRCCFAPDANPDCSYGTHLGVSEAFQHRLLA